MILEQLFENRIVMTWMALSLVLGQLGPGAPPSSMKNWTADPWMYLGVVNNVQHHLCHQHHHHRH